MAHRVGARGRGGEAVDVVEAPAQCLRALRRERGRLVIRAREADDAMSCAEELVHHQTSNPTRRTGYEYMHNAEGWCARPARKVGTLSCYKNQEAKPTMSGNGSLGAYLRELRIRLDPVSLGYPVGRRRTPGLRREEVAQRAGMSPTWYSWLEQGHGGGPSADALDRLAKALRLSDVEREHLFLLGLGRPPDVRYQPSTGVTPRLQRVLDALDACPAIIRNATWDVVAWTRAAAIVITDYRSLPVVERNVLRLTFLDPSRRAAELEWETTARIVVGVFRGDAARSGAAATVQPLVDELCAKSTDFAAMWRANEVHRTCEGVKRLRHATLGEIALEFSAFPVAGQADLTMLLYTPAAPADSSKIRSLVARD